MKLLTSNLSLKEQNDLILKQFKGKRECDISFLGTQIQGISDGKIGILKSGESTNKENVLAILKTSFLKDLFIILQEKQMKRNFEIDFDEKIIRDYLSNKNFDIKDKILFSRINSYLFPSDIFFYLKLNLKTINAKSVVYLFKDKIIYENNRGTEPFFYFFKNENKIFLTEL